MAQRLNSRLQSEIGRKVTVHYGGQTMRRILVGVGDDYLVLQESPHKRRVIPFAAITAVVADAPPESER